MPADYPKSAIRDATYYSEHKHVVLNLILRSRIMIACSAEDEDQIFGWVCYEKGLLHYIYVKTTFRNMGIGRRLLDEAGITKEKRVVFTHMTPKADKHLRGYCEKFNPYETFRELYGTSKKEAR